MTLDPWALAIILTKLAAYVSFVSLIGGFFIIWLFTTQLAIGAESTGAGSRIFALAQRLTPFLLFNSFLGLLSVSLFFLLQVGAINQNGIVGMFDWLMSTIVIQTALGDGSIWKGFGFLVFGVAALVLRRSINSQQIDRTKTAVLAMVLIGCVAACTGFAKLGHVVSLGFTEQVLVGIHVLAIAMWVGAFYPLFLLCKTESGALLHPLMKRYGDWGWGITLSLAVAGAYLLTQLLASPTELLSSAYGAMMLLKVLLVACLLGLAALNKFRLVPALLEAGEAPLARSIKGEMGLAALILIITATLSTVTGPAHLM